MSDPARRAASLLAGQEEFVRRATSEGHRGRTLLRDLGSTVLECEARWGIEVGSAFPHLSYSFVAEATRADGTACVLKLDAREEEIAALRLFDGSGAARVLEVDVEKRWLLLERLIPGTMLSTLADDDEATRIAARVMQRLWRPVPPRHRLETLEDRGHGMDRLRRTFDGATGPYPEHLVAEAEYVFAHLPVGVEPMVLHGDCHHYNILLTRGRDGGGDQWLTIDPHGVAGDPGYEVGCFIYNPGGHLDPLASPDPKARVARRVALLAEELRWDRERVRLWCLAQSVLSSWWTYEDDGFVEQDTLAVAQILFELAP